MKISVSLADDDLAFLDGYAKEQGFASRSAVVHAAVRTLKAARLGDAYAEVWREWEDSGEAEAWEPTIADGVT